MRRILTTALAGALAAASFAPLAYAQAGYDTNTNRGGATSGSGEARPDATTSKSGGAEAGASSKAAPTQGSTMGSGTARPDATSSSASGAPEASSPKKATSTDTKN